MTTTELIPASFYKVMQTRSHTVVVMIAEEKRFAIYVDPTVGRAIQMELVEAEKSRPLTHDLLQMILDGIDATVEQVVLSDLQDTIYFARLVIRYERDGATHYLDIDARPSDCIILAIIYQAPILCTREVLDKTVLIEDL